MTHPRRMLRADLALAFNALIWGATFVTVKEALGDVSTLLFLALRFSLATVALAIAFRPLPAKFARGRRVLGGGLIAGLFLFTGYFFQTVGLRYTTPSKSAFITGMSIVMVPVLAALLERKIPHAAEVIGVVVAGVGMGLLTLDPRTLSLTRGDLLTLCCAIAFAVHIVAVGHYAPRLGFEALTLMQVATAAALSLGTFWWVETPVIRWRPGVIAAVAITGLFATALAFAIQAWAQQYTSATHAALIFALEPVFAWATSFALTGELLSLRAASGAVLILCGILLVELKPLAGRPIPPD
jgi:drug/metabolite transporter (DMT)-like permease